MLKLDKKDSKVQKQSIRSVKREIKFKNVTALVASIRGKYFFALCISFAKLFLNSSLQVIIQGTSTLKMKPFVV